MSQDPHETIPMFEVPEKYRPPEKPPKAVVWASYKGARTSCDGCVRNIAKGLHRHFADSASMVRTTAKGKEFFCYKHGYEEQLQDEIAGRWKRSR